MLAVYNDAAACVPSSRTGLRQHEQSFEFQQKGVLERGAGGLWSSVVSSD